MANKPQNHGLDGLIDPDGMVAMQFESCQFPACKQHAIWMPEGASWSPSRLCFRHFTERNSPEAVEDWIGSVITNLDHITRQNFGFAQFFGRPDRLLDFGANRVFNEIFLDHVTFYRAKLCGAEFIAPKDWSKSAKERIAIHGLRFEYCDLTDARFNCDELDDSRFLNCTLNRVNWSGKGNNCVLSEVDLRGSKVHDIVLWNVDFDGVDFRGAEFKNVRIKGGYWNDVNFSGCELGSDSIEIDPSGKLTIDMESCVLPPTFHAHLKNLASKQQVTLEGDDPGNWEPNPIISQPDKLTHRQEMEVLRNLVANSPELHKFSSLRPAFGDVVGGATLALVAKALMSSVGYPGSNWLPFVVFLAAAGLFRCSRTCDHLEDSPAC